MGTLSSRWPSAGQRFSFGLVLIGVIAAAAFAASAFSETVESAPAPAWSATPVAGTWQRLPPAPFPVGAGTGQVASVWTGRQMLVFLPGRTYPAPTANAIAAYDPSTNSWRRLARPPGPPGTGQGSNKAVWTGSEMILWGITTGVFNPATNRWRPLPRSPLAGRFGAGIVVWTGRKMIGWGGGCCGDAFSDGAAYNPATNRWRKLPPAGLGGQQSPAAAWTGRELIILNGRNANGKAVGGAAYNPATNRWRRIPPLPQERVGSNVVWDGRELLVVGGAGPPNGVTGVRKIASVPYAYDPATNRWRRLAAMPSGRVGAATVWTGDRLLLWGGTTDPVARKLVTPRQGLSYDPRVNRWSALPAAPLHGRLEPPTVWTGQAMILWGGHSPDSHDGAVFRPATP